MAPKPKPIPEDFALVFGLCNESAPDIARHYSADGVPVDPRTVRRWIKEWREGGATVEENVPQRTINQIIREAGDDPAKVEVTKVKGMRYDTPTGPHTYVSAEWKPNFRDLYPRPESWKRPKIKPRKAGDNELVVICGDQHAPEHDREFHAQFLSWLAENKPSRGIVLGDLLENADISRWPDREGQALVKESIHAGYLMLRDYIEASPDTSWQWLEGNHDQRIETYASGNAPKYSGLTRYGENHPVLSIPHLMFLDDLNIEYIDGYPLAKIILTENLAVIHGKKVKQGAAATARANLDKRGYSVVSGHTHRAGVTFKTVLDINDKPSTIQGAETGTMKEIKPEVFDEAPDHQNAFITAVLWPDGQFHLEPAIYSAGHLRWRDQRY